VWTIEIQKWRMDVAREFCRGLDNINFIVGDAYLDRTYDNFPVHFDVAVIDCVHEYSAVISDINRAASFMRPGKTMYFIFDDYGHPEAPEVKQAIDYSLNNGLKLEKYIGQTAGFNVHRTDGTQFSLTDREGIIASYGRI